MDYVEEMETEGRMGYKPTCASDGKYKRKQCHWGQPDGPICWCVHTDTGKEEECDEIGKYLGFI